MKVGFTGTRNGLSPRQRTVLPALLGKFEPTHAVHGDCVGADADFDACCKNLGIICGIRPCTFESMRAYCDSEVLAEAKHPMARNRDIVADADWMIACPPNFERIKKGSGTWATIGFAQRSGKPLWIVFPDGTVKGENLKSEPQQEFQELFE